MENFKLLIFYCLLLPILAQAQNFKGVNKIKEILEFKEGTYETVLNESKYTDTSFCEDAFVDLKFIEIEKPKSLTLVIGERFSFPELQEKKYYLSSEKNCTLILTNEIKKNELVQIINADCPKNKEVFSKEHRLTQLENKITYSYTFNDSNSKKAKSNTQSCVYKFNKK